jgi:hypothetical protein
MSDQTDKNANLNKAVEALDRAAKDIETVRSGRGGSVGTLATAREEMALASLYLQAHGAPRKNGPAT